ncbi:MAG: Mov34/MPN/PAD-1 family protein [Deltaproteobacteria bacterium]|nr:Mov34/MPN/PAD-1 family protein [Deltaproteobacteria bacterium]
MAKLSNSIGKNINFFQPELKLKITISLQLLDKIKLKVIRHFPNEFGGIFVGYYDAFCKTAYITDIATQKYFFNTKISFQRFTKDINKKLNSLYQQTGGKIIYLGEWHSHPNGICSFSQTDFIAMQKIVKNKNVKIDLPLLLIYGGTKKELHYKFYVFCKDRLYQFIRN